eukprot:TRINITY_DN50530_c0_g1_i1.p1 TRINITY_DN50530_c0_g1~~TRINITY_DN50530_c0_g1_i1.p1  ORF type:complete len:605 (+),score=62.50 TRINITY_DN50530_c0_g1_i1:82-1896(+)
MLAVWCLLTAAAGASEQRRSGGCGGALRELRRRGSAVRAAIAQGQATRAARRGSGTTVFLHIPRTSGLSLLNCMLRPIYAPSVTCPAGYSMRVPWLSRDQPRSPIHGRCRVAASHLDASLLGNLTEAGVPPPRLLTVWRDPVSRVISSYDLVVANAARHVVAHQSLQRGRSRRIADFHQRQFEELMGAGGPDSFSRGTEASPRSSGELSGDPHALDHQHQFRVDANYEKLPKLPFLRRRRRRPKGPGPRKPPRPGPGQRQPPSEGGRRKLLQRGGLPMRMPEESPDSPGRKARLEALRQRLARRRAQEDGPGPTPTVDVWPWRHLILHMVRHIRRMLRLDSHQGKIAYGEYMGKGVGHSYNYTLMGKDWSPVMPLHMWVEDPVVGDLLHNLGAFMLVGATNVTMDNPEAAAVLRRCIRRQPETADDFFAEAAAVLRNVDFVGLTEKHPLTAHLVADWLGADLGAPAQQKGRLDDDSDQPQPPLHMQSCLCEQRALREKRSREVRHAGNLVRSLGVPLPADGPQRAMIPQWLKDRIKQLNSVDARLHRLARARFEARAEAAAPGLRSCKRTAFRADCHPKPDLNATPLDSCRAAVGLPPPRLSRA